MVRIHLPPPKSQRTFSPLQLDDPGRGAHRGIGLTIQGHDSHRYVPPADSDPQPVHAPFSGAGILSN